MEQAFVETLLNTARLLNQQEIDWVVFGGAAMVLHGLEQGPVADIDIVLPPQAAASLSEQFSWENHADSVSPHFRSDYVLKPDFGPVPVELLGGFRVLTASGWASVGGGDTQELEVGSQRVFLPTRERLAEIFRLCRREKDQRRAAMIDGA